MEGAFDTETRQRAHYSMIRSSASLSHLSASSGHEPSGWATSYDNSSGHHQPRSHHHRHRDPRRRIHVTPPAVNTQHSRAASILSHYESGASTPRSGSSTPRKYPSFSLGAPTDPLPDLDYFNNDDDDDHADLILPLLSPTASAAALDAQANNNIGTLSQSKHSSPSSSPERSYQLHQPKSLAGIALRSFFLGIALTVGLILTLTVLLCTSSPLWRLPFFLATLSLFHFLEFFTTAAYNTREANISSFLLTANWPSYAIAHSFASLECLVSNLVWPDRSWASLHAAGPLLCILGLVLVAVGQLVRSAAMVQAGPSFNHQVQHQRGAAHVLVTSGIYARLRHPSYFGFFWWALGTQMVMGNAVSFFMYAAVLWKFFSARIRHEEELLVKFFGDEYVDYRRTVGTKIPFVR